MNFRVKISILLIVVSTTFSCRSKAVLASEVYKSETLIVYKLTDKCYQHVSYLQTNDFGKVGCNGLIISNNGEAIVFDTPTDDGVALELLSFIKNMLQSRPIAVVPTHFHKDCLGGLTAFHDQGVVSYANEKTIKLAKETDSKVPQIGFVDSVMIRVGGDPVVAKWYGEGHTKDNVVGYFAAEQVLFGGCLIKEVNATKGFLGDANVPEWPGTVKKVKMKHPKLKVVVPGHGKAGDVALLDYTIKLFKATDRHPLR